MTKPQIEAIGLDIDENDKIAVMCVGSGLEWVLENTTYDFDIENIEELKALPYSVKLFLMQYIDVYSVGGGVSSQSIEGLSQSFNTSSKSAQIWQIAEELFSGKLKGRVSFTAASSRWK